MHFVWPIGDATKTAGVEDMLEWDILTHSLASECLDGPIGHGLTHLRGNNFDHGNKIARAFWAFPVHFIGGREHQ